MKYGVAAKGFTQELEKWAQWAVQACTARSAHFSISIFTTTWHNYVNILYFSLMIPSGQSKLEHSVGVMSEKLRGAGSTGLLDLL